MPITVTRTETDMIGTWSSPVTLNTGLLTTSGTAMSMLSPSGVIEGTVFVQVVIGSTVPATLTITYSASADGTNYLPVGPPINITPTASATYNYEYDVPDACQGVKVTTTITAGSTGYSATVLAQGVTLAVS